MEFVPINSPPDGSGGKCIYLEKKNDKSNWMKLLRNLDKEYMRIICNLFAILKLVQNKRVGDGYRYPLIDNFYPLPLPLFLSKIKMLMLEMQQPPCHHKDC